MVRLLLSLLLCLFSTNAMAFEYPDGWDQGTIKPQGIVYGVATQTTNYTVTAYQSGNTFVMTGSSNNTKFTLPLCSTQLGLDYTFIDDTTNYINIVPQSTDTIEIASTVQSNGISNQTSTAIGNNITLICRSANTWSIESSNGTWATNNL